MPMMEIPEANAAVVGDATGALTVADNAPFFPGALAWVSGAGGIARVKILRLVGTTVLYVRQFKNNNENGPPNFGMTDMSGFTSGTISQESQLVRYDPAFVKHQSV